MKHKRAFIPLFLIIFIDTMGYGLIIPVMLRLLHETGSLGYISGLTPAFKNIIFGCAVAISPFAYLFAAPIIGSWSDKWGRKNTLLICLIGSCIGFILPVFGVMSGSLVLIFLGRILSGAASSSQPIAQAAVTDICTAKEKPFYLAMIAFAMTLAMVAGPLLGGYLSDPNLVSWFNNTTPFMAASVLVFGNILLLHFFFRETNQNVSKHGLLTWRETFWALTAVFSNKAVRVFMLVFLLYEFAWSLYFQDIALYLTHGFGYSVDQISVFIAYSGLWMSLGLTIFYKHIVKILALKQLLILSLGTAAIGLVGCAFGGAVEMQWIFVIPLSIGVGMAYPTILALMSDRVEKKHQGWIMGVAGSGMALTWMSSSLMTGFLTNIYLALPLQLALIAMLLSLVPLLVKFRSSAYKESRCAR